MNYSDLARRFLGTKEGSQQHHHIIDEYNKIKPLPNGYRMTYRDAWCACFVSYVLYKCGAVKAPYSASANDMRSKAIHYGEYRREGPKVNDIVFYDWKQNGHIDHVGIVAKVDGNTIEVIEGNKSDQVGKRIIDKHSSSIAGYATVPQKTPAKKPKTDHEKEIVGIAHDVIKGKYGNGKTRIALLKKRGVDPQEVQNKVNELLRSK